MWKTSWIRFSEISVLENSLLVLCYSFEEPEACPEDVAHRSSHIVYMMLLKHQVLTPVGVLISANDTA